MTWGYSRQPVGITIVLLSFTLMVSWTPSRQLGCGELEQLELQLQGTSWSKVLYRAELRGHPVAVRTLNARCLEMEACQSLYSKERCYRRQAARLFREMIILQHLEHQNVIKVLGSCIRSMDGPLFIATEFGDPLDTVALQRLSWEERLKILLSITSIIHYLARSPLGSLGVKDMKRYRFVLVKGLLKISDVDDVDMNEPPCLNDSDCASYFYRVYNDVQCISGRCRGHNEYSNILKAGEDIVCSIIAQGGPTELQGKTQEILEAYRGLKGWNTSRLLKETEELQSMSR